MSDPNAFPDGESKSGRNRPDEHWHDLVAAVVAVKGSPGVRAPAAVLAGIERKLGFVPQRQGWLRVPVFLGGVAAALVFALGWLAWQSGAPHNKVEVASSGAPNMALSIEKNHTGTSVPATAATRPAPGPMASQAINTAARNGIAAKSDVVAVPLTQQLPFAVAARDFAPGGMTGDRSGFRSAEPFSDTEVSAGGATRLGETGGMIELKSDYYVAGLLAAAMQNPVSTNPYEPALQPVEWSDWLSGYELGTELPSNEALALGATWKWSDPETLSLVTGLPSEEVGAAAIIARPKQGAAAIIEEPKQSAASRISEGNATVQGLAE